MAANIGTLLPDWSSTKRLKLADSLTGMEMPLGERIASGIEAAAKRRHLTLAQVAERAGLGRRTLGKILAGENTTVGTLEKLAGVLRLKPWELLTTEAERRDLGLFGEEQLPSNYVRIPRLDIAASAGAGSAVMDRVEVLEHLDVLASWVRRVLGVPDAERLRVIDVKGDSMSPTMNHGDVAFVDVHDCQFDGEGIYTLVWQDHLLIKRLRIAGDAHVAIHSDNATAYPPEYVRAEESDQLTICGRVVGWWSLRRY